MCVIYKGNGNASTLTNRATWATTPENTFMPSSLAINSYSVNLQAWLDNVSSHFTFLLCFTRQILWIFPHRFHRMNTPNLTSFCRRANGNFNTAPPYQLIHSSFLHDYFPLSNTWKIQRTLDFFYSFWGNFCFTKCENMAATSLNIQYFVAQ